MHKGKCFILWLRTFLTNPPVHSGYLPLPTPHKKSEYATVLWSVIFLIFSTGSPHHRVGTVLKKIPTACPCPPVDCEFLKNVLSRSAYNYAMVFSSHA